MLGLLVLRLPATAAHTPRPTVSPSPTRGTGALASTGASAPPAAFVIGGAALTAAGLLLALTSRRLPKRW